MASSDGSIQGGGNAGPRPGKRRVPVAIIAATVAGPLLALAVLLICWSVRESHSIGRVVVSQGDVKVTRRSENGVDVVEVETGADGIWRADRRDGTIIALDRNTTLVWKPGSEEHSPETWVKGGQIYLDVVKPESSLHVRTGELQVDVAGARLLVTSVSEYERISVLAGEVKASGKRNTVIYGRKGQHFYMHREFYRRIFESPVAGLDPGTDADAYWQSYPSLEQRVRCNSSKDAELSWLSRCGLDGQAIQRAAVIGPAREDAPDLNSYVADGGVWRVDAEAEEGKASIVQENPKVAWAMIFLDPVLWKRGEVLFEYQVKSCQSGAAIGMRTYEYHYHHRISEGFAHLQDSAGQWMKMRFKFEVPTNQPVRILESEFGPIDEPFGKLASRPTRDWSASSPHATRGGERGIGLDVRNCSVEIRNLKITNTE